MIINYIYCMVALISGTRFGDDVLLTFKQKMRDFLEVFSM